MIMATYAFHLFQVLTLVDLEEVYLDVEQYVLEILIPYHERNLETISDSVTSSQCLGQLRTVKVDDEVRNIYKILCLLALKIKLAS